MDTCIMNSCIMDTCIMDKCITDAFLGKLMGDTRRATSTVVVRSQAMCLLERISQLGPGARAAAQRRQATLRLEERRRRERQAYSQAHERRGRVGRVFID